MAAIAGPTALDRIPELRSEIDRLERDNVRLQTQLAEARHTIRRQEDEIEMASQELKKALGDFVDLERQVAQWHEQLGRLDAEVEQTQSKQRQVLDDLDDRLEEILTGCRLEEPSDGTAGQAATSRITSGGAIVQ